MRLAVVFAPSVFFAPEVAVVATVHSSLSEAPQQKEVRESRMYAFVREYTCVYVHHVMQAWLHAK